MIDQRRLISLQGFYYIHQLLSMSERLSKDSLKQILNSLVEISPARKRFHSSKLNRKKLRKQDQINGISDLIKFLGDYKTILEIGAGNGDLSFHLAQNPEYDITAIDSNKELVDKNNSRNSHSNLRFECEDAFGYSPTKKDLVVSLHGCGDLTDRVIDIAIEADADILSVPCCYSRIKTRKGRIVLPRSSQLKGDREFFRKDILGRLLKIEGMSEDGKQTKMEVVRDLYRFLVNFDRIFRLNENSYSVSLSTITGDHTDSENREKRYANSSLRYAILGRKIR